MQAWQAVALQRSQHSHLMLSTSQLGPARFISPHVLPHSIELTSVSVHSDSLAPSLHVYVRPATQRSRRCAGEYSPVCSLLVVYQTTGRQMASQVRGRGTYELWWIHAVINSLNDGMKNE